MLVFLSIIGGAGLTVLVVGLGIHASRVRERRRLLRAYHETGRRIEARYEAAALLAIQHYFTRQPRG